MSIPVKELKNGFKLPVYGLGLWQIGGKREADTTNDVQSIAAIQKAISLGVTHFDTAEGYGAGHAEEILGKAIDDFDRSRFIITTKVAGIHQAYDNLLRSCEASLKRLDTDYIDLYLLHEYPPAGIDISSTMRAMERLMDEGIVKNIGVSNFTTQRLDEAQQHTKYMLVCNQVHYNLQFREIEDRGILRQAQEKDIMLVAWRPIQKGALPHSKLIDKLSVKYDKTPIQLAINWLIAQQNVVTIAKTNNAKHLEENIGALNWTMESEDVEELRREFPDQKFISDTFPLDY